jgi:tRNA pseudouridine38-40 synthase
MAMAATPEQAERNIKLVLAYEGTGLSGWQRQSRDPSVQDYMEKALGRLTGEKITVFGAGRTDAGVHARGQTANFRTRSVRTCAEFLKGGNALLPRQVAILSVQEVPLDFHARYSARGKIYDYDLDLGPVRPVLNRQLVWYVGPDLDLSAMGRAWAMILGRHDFAAFQSTGTPVKSTIREMFSAELSRPEPLTARLSVEGDGFLRHMVRAMVGTVVLVGQGRVSPEGFMAILAGRDRSRAGPTAPAHGLCLREVRY